MMNTAKTTSPAALMQRRSDLGVTLKELAAASGVSISLITKLSSGHRTNPTYEKLRRLDEALNRLEAARATQGA